MKSSGKVLFSLLMILAFLLILQTQTGEAAEPQQHTDKCYLQLLPSNYCQSCHSTGDPRVLGATTWTGGLDRATASPCPAVKAIGEELFYTERMLLAIDRAQTQLPATADTTRVLARLDSASQTYSRLLDTPVTSLDAFVSEAQVLRYRLGKVYTEINQLIEQNKQRRVLLFAGLISLLVLISLVWGWRNSQKAIQRSGVRSKSLPSMWAAILVILLVFLVFSLPIFRGASQEVTATTLEKQEQQAIMDSALRSVDIADREQARAWMMAQAAAAQNQIDPLKAEQWLSDALAAASEAQNNALVVWGEAKSAQEASAGEWAVEDKALFITAQLDSMRSRSWGLQLIAETWIAVDPLRAAEILEQAVKVTEGTVGDYQDLDLRKIAVTYAQIDIDRSLQIIDLISSPVIRAWGLREIAALTGDSKHLEMAGDSARRVGDPVQQARALEELAKLTGQSIYLSEAEQALLSAGEQDAILAFAWSELAVLTGTEAHLQKIEAGFPDARAYALLGMGRYPEAFQASGEITDPYVQARAQEAIASQWASAEAALKISVPLFRDRALSNVSIKLRDLSLAKKIENVYYRVRALTGTDQLSPAIEAAADLSDAYPLVELAQKLAGEDPQSALALVEMMDREADKAQALRVIALEEQSSELFGRALSLALAARIRGDSLAPALASLGLGMDFLEIDLPKADQAFIQAFDIAWRMLIKYE